MVKGFDDEGVNFIVGCHSHCVQGGEKYKDGYIVYGLGNFICQMVFLLVVSFIFLICKSATSI
ncbi:MAG: CapA family protein [Saprospiraceae bacterium]|nr:CapA family protein [Saprospiraceae bacterium]